MRVTAIAIESIPVIALLTEVRLKAPIPAIFLLAVRVTAIEILEIRIVAGFTPHRVDHTVAADDLYLFTAQRAERA